MGYSTWGCKKVGHDLVTKPEQAHWVLDYPGPGKMELEAMSRYISPVNPAVFPHLTVVLLAIGMFFTAWFFVYEVTSTKYTRDIYKEFLISLVASLFMGFGVLFLLLWVSIYI